MSQQVVAGAMMKCSFGLAPSVLSVLPEARVVVEGRPAASISSTAATKTSDERTCESPMVRSRGNWHRVI